MLRLWWRVLYKEPFDGPLPRTNLGVGCFAIFVGLFGVFSRGPTLLVGPMLLASGLTFVWFGVSDLLPPERRFAVVDFRIGFPVFQSATIILAVAGLLQQGLGLGF